MSIPLSDQETCFSYLHETGEWRIYTNVKKHITKYTPLVKNPKTIQENGRVISIEGVLDNVTVSVYKKRKYDEKTRELMRKRMLNVREGKPDD